MYAVSLICTLVFWASLQTPRFAGVRGSAPLLWRLDHYGIDVPKSAVPLMKYAERIFSRPAFIEALTPSEKVMRR